MLKYAHIPYILACRKLMWIRILLRIQIITLMRIRMRVRILLLIYADADPGYLNDADPCRSESESGSTTLLKLLQIIYKHTNFFFIVEKTKEAIFELQYVNNFHSLKKKSSR